MSNDAATWLPEIALIAARSATVAPSAQPAPVLPPVPQTVVVTKAADPAPQPKTPRGWRFVPERDADNLIVEIIATPIF